MARPAALEALPSLHGHGDELQAGRIEIGVIEVVVSRVVPDQTNGNTQEP